jgi:hypothetical protein
MRPTLFAIETKCSRAETNRLLLYNCGILNLKINIFICNKVDNDNGIHSDLYQLISKLHSPILTGPEILHNTQLRDKK